MERLKQEERLQRFREEEQKRQQEGRLRQLLEETKGNCEAQRVSLEEQLSQEKQVRYEIQKAAEAQINGLQAEIKRLMEKRLSIDAYSEGSLIAPAPSLQSLTLSQTLQPQPSPVLTTPPTVTDGMNRTREIHGKTAKTMTLDLLEQIMQAANTN
ncbi:M protein, serotype 49-like [Emydura macquarii macquarii]|uniref:M protein, serotype 49-like n=1 Tax=Emydura macquarii macquarii TaxID=1129001 RepID=UPI00352BA352